MAAFRLLWLASAASAAAPAAAGAAVAAPTAPAKVPDDPLLLCLERFANFDGAFQIPAPGGGGARGGGRAAAEEPYIFMFIL